VREEQFDTAKARLQHELHQFLAEILATDATRVDSFALAVKQALEKRGVDLQVQLAGDVNARIQAIEKALRDLPASSAGLLEQHLDDFRSDLREAVRKISNDAREASAIRVLRADASGTATETLNIRVEPPHPGTVVWLLTAMLLLCALSSLASLFLLVSRRTATPPTSVTSQAQTDTTARVLVVDTVAEQGWRAFLRQVQGKEARLPLTDGFVLCGSPTSTTDSCAALDSATRRWAANPALAAAAADELKARAATLCPGVAFTAPTDRGLDDVLDCLRAGAPPQG
jgi:hypothetical protein